MPPLIGSVGSTSRVLSMPWSLALSARADEARDATGRGWRSGTGRRGTGRGGRACPGDSLRMSRPFQMTSPPLIDVGRVAHQGVGEGRLARAVGAHDRVDLALADRQVDALEDLVLRGGDGRDAQAADDEVLVGRRWLVGHGRVRAPWSGVGSDGAGGGRDARRDEVGEGHRVEGAGDRVADADPQDVDGAAGRAIAQDGVLGVVAGADHRRDRALERAQDLAHRDRLGRAGELVAAVRAARARDEAGFAEAHDELLEVGARQVLLGGDLGQAGRPACRSGARAGPSAGRRTRPSWRRRRRRCRGRRGGSGRVSRSSRWAVRGRSSISE